MLLSQIKDKEKKKQIKAIT